MTQQITTILEKRKNGMRISSQEALLLLKEGDFLEIQKIARDIRNQMHDPKIATYTVFQIVNYSTFCNVDCNFCSYYEPYGSSRGKRLTVAEIVAKMKKANQQTGVEQMFLQGGVDMNLPFDYYLQVISAVKREVGQHIHIRAFSPVELLGMEKKTGKKLSWVLNELKKAGLDSVPGAGAEILSDRVRNILSPKKIGSQEWLRIMRICHEENLPGSANIVFGSVEKPEEIIEHLQHVRDLQDQTQGFLSFIPWIFQQQTKKFKVRTVLGPEYLRVLGVSRIFLDNIAHLETSLMVMGQQLGSLALHGGADDVSSVVLEENVLRNHGFKDEEKTLIFLRNCGFQPRKRTLLYE